MQFARQNAEAFWAWRKLLDQEEIHPLDSRLSLDLYSQYFVDSKSELVASMLHLAFNRNVPELQEMDERIDISVKSHIHGQKLTNEMDDEKFFALHDSTLNRVLFDESGYFAGLDFIDLKYGYHKEQVAPVLNDLWYEQNPDVYKDTNDYTRLVGFRTTKDCKDSMHIRSV